LIVVIVAILFIMIMFFKYYTQIAAEFARTFQPITNALAEGKFG